MTSPAVHPLALLIPEMDPDQFAELRADVERHGLIEPIVLHEHMILDGRHRARACEETGVEPRYRDFDGASPVEFVLSVNVKRRHLTPSQRAVIGVAFLPALEEEAKARQGARIDLATSGSPEPEVAHPSPHRAREDAGALVGVSGATIDRAKRVQREDPEMFEQVKAGAITVREADTALRERKQGLVPRVVNPIKQHHMPAASKIVPRVLSALRVQAAELQRALEEGTVQTEEAADWSRDLSDVLRSLRASNTRLKEC